VKHHRAKQKTCADRRKEKRKINQLHVKEGSKTKSKVSSARTARSKYQHYLRRCGTRYFSSSIIRCYIFNYVKIYSAKYFSDRTIICAQFLRRNITTDRNKLRLLHRPQSPHSGACLSHRGIDIFGSSPVADQSLHRLLLHGSDHPIHEAVESTTSTASTASAGRLTSTSIPS
jgi:hypothetical protein